MLKYHSRQVRVNKMGGKFYVELRDKAFEFSDVYDSPPVIDNETVKEFSTEEEATAYINKLVP